MAPALLLGIAGLGLGLAWLPLGRLLAVVRAAADAIAGADRGRLAKAPVGYVTAAGGRRAWSARPRSWASSRVAADAVATAPTGGRSPRSACSRCSCGRRRWARERPSALTVRFFDVGQGDSALVTSPAGASVLIDGGPDEEQVATELAALGVKRLDVVVASHPHADHIVGLPDVLARIPVGLVLEPGCDRTSALQAELTRRDRRRRRARRGTREAGVVLTVATSASTSCRRTSAGRAPSRTRTTTPSCCG